MVLRFSFSNFRSFREDQEISFVAASTFKDSDSALIHSPNLREATLPVAAIYGPNASGKTNAIRALFFFEHVIGSSHRFWAPDSEIPREPFGGGPEAKESRPSRFELEFLIEGIRHRYGFELDSNSILEEWLFVYPNGKKQTWFHREKGHPIVFGAKMLGPNKVIEEITRANSLFLSAAAQNNHESLTRVFEKLKGVRFVSDLVPRTAYANFAAQTFAHDHFGKTVRSFLREADLGIVDMEIEKIQPPEEIRTRKLAFFNSIGLPDAEVDDYKLRLVHLIGDMRIPFEEQQESAGTLAYIRVLAPVLRALDEGALIAVDELDASLHSLLASHLVQLFQNPKINSKGAQLLFTTHDTTLMNSANLRRDQIWFTEKSRDGESHLYPLTDFKPRKNENLENGYLQGRYGAIPFLDPHSFLAQLVSEQ